MQYNHDPLTRRGKIHITVFSVVGTLFFGGVLAIHFLLSFHVAVVPWFENLVTLVNFMVWGLLVMIFLCRALQLENPFAKGSRDMLFIFLLVAISAFFLKESLWDGKFAVLSTVIGYVTCATGFLGSIMIFFTTWIFPPERKNFEKASNILH